MSKLIFTNSQDKIHRMVYQYLYNMKFISMHSNNIERWDYNYVLIQTPPKDNSSQDFSDNKIIFLDEKNDANIFLKSIFNTFSLQNTTPFIIDDNEDISALTKRYENENNSSLSLLISKKTYCKLINYYKNNFDNFSNNDFFKTPFFPSNGKLTTPEIKFQKYIFKLFLNQTHDIKPFNNLTEYSDLISIKENSLLSLSLPMFNFNNFTMHSLDTSNLSLLEKERLKLIKNKNNSFNISSYVNFLNNKNIFLNHSKNDLYSNLIYLSPFKQNGENLMTSLKDSLQYINVSTKEKNNFINNFLLQKISPESSIEGTVNYINLLKDSQLFSSIEICDYIYSHLKEVRKTKYHNSYYKRKKISSVEVLTDELLKLCSKEDLQYLSQLNANNKKPIEHFDLMINKLTSNDDNNLYDELINNNDLFINPKQQKIIVLDLNHENLKKIFPIQGDYNNTIGGFFLKFSQTFNYGFKFLKLINKNTKNDYLHIQLIEKEDTHILEENEIRKFFLLNLSNVSKQAISNKEQIITFFNSSCRELLLSKQLNKLDETTQVSSTKNTRKKI